MIVGQTGSGKTTFAVWLLERLPNSPVLIYDTKEEPKFLTLKKSAVAYTFREVIELSTDHGIDYIVFRPPVRMLSDPRALDNYLLVHYQHLRGVDAYIDELYSFHNHGNAGPGLVALYTRGRSRGITTIASTQRPAWISKFSMSEAQLFYQFFLSIASDRKTLADATGIVPLENPPKHSFWAWRSGAHVDTPQLIRPIRHDAALAGYTDAPEPAPDVEQPSAVPAIGHLWI